MTIEQDFLPYAVGSNANVLTQSQYSALTTLLQSGMSAGIVPSNQLNKILRQPSIIASVIAQLIVANSGQPAIDDGTTATLLANLQTAITVIARQNPVLADTGTANAYAAANAAAFTAYPSVSGLVIDVSIANANTGASTLAIDGLAAKPIYGLALLPLQGGELPKGIASFIYIVASNVNSGNGAWVLIECTGGAQQVGVATASQHAATLGQVQSGLSSYAVDAGTANTYVVTLSPAITAYADGVKIRFRALTANTGASTLNVNGLGAVALVGGAHAALAGGEIIPGGYCEAEYNGALSKFVLLECTGGAVQVANATASQHAVPLGQAQSLISAAQTPQLMPLTASVASNLITANLAAVSLEFRNATLSTGSGTTVAVPALSVAIPSIAASLGATTAVAAQIAVLVAYNAGTPVLCLANMSGGLDLSETGLISPTTISASATANNVIYSASAVAASSPYRVVGYFTGTWTSGTGWALTQVQPYGGQAMAAMQSLGYGQTWQSVTRTSGVTYYNTTPRPISLKVDIGSTGSTGTSISINGVAMGLMAFAFSTAGTQYASGQMIIQPGASYMLTDGGSRLGTYELR